MTQAAAARRSRSLQRERSGRDLINRKFITLGVVGICLVSCFGRRCWSAVNISEGVADPAAGRRVRVKVLSQCDGIHRLLSCFPLCHSCWAGQQKESTLVGGNLTDEEEMFDKSCRSVVSVSHGNSLWAEQWPRLSPASKSPGLDQKPGGLI